MAAETFFARWSRIKAEARTDTLPPAAPLAPVADAHAPEMAPADAPECTAPTLEQAQSLTTDSDFKPFVARGVDESVRRAAMKKLFADPHFNVMDGLDTYIDDYNKPEPLTPLMVAALNHAKDLIAREFTAAADEEHEPKDEDL